MEWRDLRKQQILPYVGYFCNLGGFLHSADATVGMTDVFCVGRYKFKCTTMPAPRGRMAMGHRRYSASFNVIPLAFCPILCYAVLGATSTPAGGSPRVFRGYTSFGPRSYKEGVLHLVTWPNLIEFCSFLVALITLIIGIIDHNSKK